MYSIHPAVQSRLRPLLGRVLIADPSAHGAGLLSGCLTAFGCPEVVTEGDPVAALARAETLNPTLIITEAFGDADPFALVRSIRRAALACRQAPIVVFTTLATTSAMGLAKEAGAHEFLRKPFSHRDLMRRLDQLARQPRPWVEKAAYVGPDRRLFNSGAAKRRLSDRLELIGQGVSATSLYLRRPSPTPSA